MAKKKDKRPVWAGDCETDPFMHGRVPAPFIWGLWTGATYHEFDTPEEFADFVRDQDVIIYFHNGGKFDLHFLLKHINLFEPVKVINGRLVVAHIGVCELRDSWNLLPIPLAVYKKDSEEEIRRALVAVGEDANLAADYRLMEEANRNRPGVRRVIRDYLRNDCLFLYELVTQFEADYGRHLTQAGAAMAAWKRMSGLDAPHSDREYFEAFAPFYYGGRVECFEKGKIDGPVEIVDMRSAYPRAMLDYHPYGTDHHVTENFSDFLPTSLVTIEAVANGSLPYRTERGAIIFPDDNLPRIYNVTGHELLAAIDTGSVRVIRKLRCVDFDRLVTFREYIEHFYALRKEARTAGNRAVDIFCKLLMNSLYGKFGANPDNYGNFQCVPFADFEQHLTDGYEFDGLVGPYALLRAPLDEWQCRFLNVATAASITGAVRARLWRAIHACDKPYYCDTDSLFCAGFSDALDIGPELGQWEHEGTAQRLWIAGKKMYLAENVRKPGRKRPDPAKPHKMATKGVRLTAQQIKRLCKGDTVVYQPQVPTFSLRRPPGFTDRAITMT
jgi:hypothetical protein